MSGNVMKRKRKKSRPRRYLPGDFWSPGNVPGFQQAFFEAMQRTVPAVTNSLRDNVLPIYCRAADSELGTATSGALLWSSAKKRLRWQVLAVCTDIIYPNLIPLRDGLRRWAKHWNMEDVDWFLDRALFVLSNWHSTPETLALDLFPEANVALGRGELTESERHFRFEHEGWTPDWEHWPDFEHKVCIQFEAELSLYRKRIGKMALDRGYKRVPKRSEPTHFDCLVLYRCAEMEADDIAKQLNISGDKTRIFNGLKTAAKLLGIDHRKRRTVEK
jgi:hypothetical protein